MYYHRRVTNDISSKYTYTHGTTKYTYTYATTYTNIQQIEENVESLNLVVI